MISLEILAAAIKNRPGCYVVANRGQITVYNHCKFSQRVKCITCRPECQNRKQIGAH